MKLYALCSGKAQGPIPQDAVQALDVALKNTASNHPDCVTLPRAFFFYDREMVKTVGGGAEVSCTSTGCLHMSLIAHIDAQHGKQPFFQHLDFPCWVSEADAFSIMQMHHCRLSTRA